MLLDLGLGIVSRLPPLVQGLVTSRFLFSFGRHGFGFLQILAALHVLLPCPLQRRHSIMLKHDTLQTNIRNAGHKGCSYNNHKAKTDHSLLLF